MTAQWSSNIEWGTKLYPFIDLAEPNREQAFSIEAANGDFTGLNNDDVVVRFVDGGSLQFNVSNVSVRGNGKILDIFGFVINGGGPVKRDINQIEITVGGSPSSAQTSPRYYLPLDPVVPAGPTTTE